MENILKRAEYDELNNYLKSMFSCFEREMPDIITNLEIINKYSFALKEKLKQYDLKHEVGDNNLDFATLLDLTRKIIGSINSDYLRIFDKAFMTGSINFNYGECDLNGEAIKSQFNFSSKNHTKSILVNRNFNYSDVKVLVHEFMHYVGLNFDKEIKNYYFLSEFIAIYFETYADDYMCDLGIDKSEIDYATRLDRIQKRLTVLVHESSVLLAYYKNHKITENTCYELDSLNLPEEVTSERFNRNCKILLNKFRKIKQDVTAKDNEENYHYLLTKSFVSNTNYVLGVLLTFYARKNNDVDTIICLNNSLQNPNVNINELLSHFNIDINSDGFTDIALSAVDEYISKYNIKKR